MRNLLILLLIIVGSNLYGQTDSIEKAMMHDRFLSKEITQEEFSEIGINWNLAIKKFDKYPDLPLDQNAQVHYSFLNNFKNMNKQKLFNRALEFISLNYGIFPPNLYSNLEEGKIILNHSFYIDATYSGTYTGIFSIKDEKIRAEFINVGYQIYHPGYSALDFWVPESTSSFSINQLYPVISKNSKDWSKNLNLFKTTNEYFQNEIDRLYDYSKDYDSNYTF